jgi:hypothetical protein
MADARAPGEQVEASSDKVKTEPAAAPSPILQQIHHSQGRNVQFAPVYGQDADQDAFCSILRIEGFTILLDCGWTEACDPALVAPLEAVAPEVNLVSKEGASFLRTPSSSRFHCNTYRASICNEPWQLFPSTFLIHFVCVSS